MKLLLLSSLWLTLTSCASLLDDAGLKDETLLPPSYPADIPPPPKSNGTIYQQGYEVSLYKDRIANRVGDILTVRLEETTTGIKQANMKTTKVSTFDSNNGTLTTPVMANGIVRSAIFDVGTNNQFEGKGATNQSNQLSGNVSVTVMRVLANNNLIIQGESWITINQGREYIRLTGIVRPEDIGAENIISSQRVANARITYSGNGQVSNTARGGLLTQFFNKFFPY
jgi:flagellar L-ring protein precursor FlgH